MVVWIESQWRIPVETECFPSRSMQAGVGPSSRVLAEILFETGTVGYAGHRDSATHKINISGSMNAIARDIKTFKFNNE